MKSYVDFPHWQRAADTDLIVPGGAYLFTIEFTSSKVGDALRRDTESAIATALVSLNTGETNVWLSVLEIRGPTLVDQATNRQRVYVVTKAEARATGGTQPVFGVVLVLKVVKVAFVAAMLAWFGIGAGPSIVSAGKAAADSVRAWFEGTVEPFVDTLDWAIPLAACAVLFVVFYPRIVKAVRASGPGRGELPDTG